MDGLEPFVVRAKAATYVGSGQPAKSSRLGSHDFCHDNGLWHYRDSYFGGTEFIGQEAVWHADLPVWAMHYDGRILRDALIEAARAAIVIRAALTALYAKERFQGGFQFHHARYHTTDTSTGTVGSFSGVEHILAQGELAYQLDYPGGLIAA